MHPATVGAYDPEQRHSTSEAGQFTSIRRIGFFLGLTALAFLLRIFYSEHLYQDDGFWFTAAEEILRGKVLYREIYFDKPPLLPLLYAGLFKIFGPHILVIRIATIVYSVLIAVVLYRFARYLYGHREGLLASIAFVLFSTTYFTGHFQGLNTDFLMVLPYTLGAFHAARLTDKARPKAPSALLVGFWTGIAFNVNPKGVVNFAFLFLLVALAKLHSSREKREDYPNLNGHRLNIPLVFGLALSGFLISTLPILVYLLATKSLTSYWVFFWQWGSRYAVANPFPTVVWTALTSTVGYFALNATLLIGLILVLLRAGQDDPGRQSEGDQRKNGLAIRPDWIVLLFFAISYIGLSIGGRFYGHYFFLTLPSLCLAVSAALVPLLWRNESAAQSFSPRYRKPVLALIAVALVVTVVRYHTLTVQLAADAVKGRRSDSTSQWLHERLNADEKLAADFITQEVEAGPDKQESEPGNWMDAGTVFVWGYRPEIYFWSRLRPASRYLSSQPLTGVAADRSFFTESTQVLIDSPATVAARAELVTELLASKPRFIVDELGFYNAALAIKNFPELSEVLTEYRNVGQVGTFILYRKKDPEKKNRRRMNSS